MSAEAHMDAVLARLRAHPQLVGAVFDGEQDSIPAGLQRYVVVYSNGGLRTSDRLEGSQADVTTTHWTHCVGLTKAQARRVNGFVMAQLIDWRPAIPGRSCWRVKHAASQPIRLDKDVTPWRSYGVDEFDLHSTPA